MIFTSKMINDPPPPIDWFLRDARANGAGVLQRGKVGMLVGEGGAGKPMALCQLAIAVATGGLWLGTFMLPRNPGRALLLLGEEDAPEVQRRLYNAVRATGSDHPSEGSIVVMPLAGVPCPMVELDRVTRQAYDGAFLDELRTYLADQPAFDLIVVDPLSRFAPANTMATSLRLVQVLESIAQDYKATVFVSHLTHDAEEEDEAKLLCPFVMRTTSRHHTALDCRAGPNHIGGSMIDDDEALAEDAAGKKARRAAVRAANKEKYAARKAAYYAENKEKIASQQAAYRAANKDKYAAYQTAYRAANKEKEAARQAAYRARKKEEQT
jgi:RecA-family ATPase